METTLQYIEKNRENFLGSLKEFLKIPSVSADPAFKNAMQQAAQFEVNHFKKIGLENVQLLETGGYPVIYGDWLHAPGKPTLLIYGHYDVQPPDPLELWETPPFEPRVQGNWLIARGADDNKGQHWAHICAIEAHLKATGKLPVNIKVIIEGEEEYSTGNTDRAVEKNAPLLACDAVLVSDSTWYDKEHPAICLSLRGIASFEIKLKGPDRDIHSGIYGGKVRNPLNTLAQILAQLKNSDGQILIPNF